MKRFRCTNRHAGESAMARKSKVTVITYNGVDGACAAAAVLLKHPRAEVRVSSARGIADTFTALQDKQTGCIHVCGVGVTCPWGALAAALRPVQNNGVKVYWHCGRGYFTDDQEENFGRLCHTRFMDAGTNTAALAEHFGVSHTREGQWLVELSWHDRHVSGHKGPAERSKEESDWLDLIDASLAQYFKYQDRDPYLRCIGKLARQDFTEDDHVAIEAFRRTGYKYLLHGGTPAVRQLKERIQRCADANRHIIITGESGTGKEHVAHLLWERSPRAMGPMVAVNCALYAGSANLANSDLFGHRKGAFTGAERDRQGKFVAAHRGILFLDEIGELPPEVQAKLLRVLEDGRVTPEGADQYEQEVDVCVIAATHRDLPRMIRKGLFRADLYHRLATLRIHVPPLRDRVADIDIIVAERLEILAEEGRTRKLSKRDFARLREYAWPGNVRQLIKLIDRATLLDLSIKEVLEEEQALGVLEEEEGQKGEVLLPSSREDVRPLEEVQRRYARHAWELHHRQHRATANALGISENTLRYKYLADG